MSDEKNVSISFRVAPRFKRLLLAAAEREYRSQTNLQATLLFAPFIKHGIEEDAGGSPSRVKQGKKK